jgi:hypothetical protein
MPTIQKSTRWPSVVQGCAVALVGFGQGLGQRQLQRGLGQVGHGVGDTSSGAPLRRPARPGVPAPAAAPRAAPRAASRPVGLQALHQRHHLPGQPALERRRPVQPRQCQVAQRGQPRQVQAKPRASRSVVAMVRQRSGARAHSTRRKALVDVVGKAQRGDCRGGVAQAEVEPLTGHRVKGLRGVSDLHAAAADQRAPGVESEREALQVRQGPHAACLSQAARCGAVPAGGRRRGRAPGRRRCRRTRPAPIVRRHRCRRAAATGPAARQT